MTSPMIKHHASDTASIETILETILNSKNGLRIHIKTIDGKNVDEIKPLHGNLICFKEDKDFIGFAVQQNALKRSYRVTTPKDMATFMSWLNNVNLEDYSDNSDAHPLSLNAHFESKTL